MTSYFNMNAFNIKIKGNYLKPINQKIKVPLYTIKIKIGIFHFLIKYKFWYIIRKNKFGYIKI